MKNKIWILTMTTCLIAVLVFSGVQIKKSNQITHDLLQLYASSLERLETQIILLNTEMITVLEEIQSKKSMTYLEINNLINSYDLLDQYQRLYVIQIQDYTSPDVHIPSVTNKQVGFKGGLLFYRDMSAYLSTLVNRTHSGIMNLTSNDLSSITVLHNITTEVNSIYIQLQDESFLHSSISNQLNQRINVQTRLYEKYLELNRKSASLFEE